MSKTINEPSKTLAEWTAEVHQLAVDKGWWPDGAEVNPLEKHMLIVSEIAEATEEARKGKPPIYQIVLDCEMSCDPPDPTEFYTHIKPEGEMVELADAVIRIMDYFGARGWDLEAAIQLKHEYNKTRPHRHGGKRY